MLEAVEVGVGVGSLSMEAGGCKICVGWAPVWSMWSICVPLLSVFVPDITSAGDGGGGKAKRL